MSIAVGSKLIDKLSSEQTVTPPSQWERPKQQERTPIGFSGSVLGALLQEPTARPKPDESPYQDLDTLVASSREALEKQPKTLEIDHRKNWETPEWFRRESQEIHWIIDELDVEVPKYAKGPKIKARSAFIVDIDSGEVLWHKAPDTRRAVASLTKVMSSLTLSRQEVDLEKEVCLDQTISTGFPGAKTRLSASDCTTGWDVMGAALVSSDNGAAYAYPLIADQSHEQFSMHMNEVAQDIGMTQSEFVDPAGVNDENISTARDLTKMAIVAAFDDNVSIPSSSTHWYAQISGQEKVYHTTNVAKSRAEFLLAKTGYTHTARAGFTGVYQKNGRRIAFTILGGWYPSTRNRDIVTVMDWVERHP